MKNYFKKVGPALVTASLVIGPGSVTVATKAGSLHGYDLLFALPILWVLMCAFTYMGAKIGLADSSTPLSRIATSFGRPVAMLMGMSVFYICTIFQAGDVIGVSAAMSIVLGVNPIVFYILFPAVCLIVYFKSPNVYQWIERMMLILVALMLGAFLLNLFWAKPSPAAVLGGMVPHVPTNGQIGLLSAMSATNFVVAAAFYQAYLVREKGWKKEDTSPLLDTIIGITVLFVIVGVVTITSAAVLKSRGIVVNSAADMAMQLEPLLGINAKILFSLGLFSASFSSLAVNALTGATLMADGMGQGQRLSDKAVKRYAALIMGIGVVVALIFGSQPVKAIITLQRLTLLPVPLLAIGMIWLVNKNGGNKIKLPVNIIAFAGVILILYLAVNTILMLKN